jgi:amino acid adenylation domain-containing protein
VTVREPPSVAASRGTGAAAAASGTPAPEAAGAASYAAVPSFGQQRLWMLDRLLPDKAAYNETSVHRLKGALDVAALARALTEIVRRHHALRTSFAVADGELRQVVAPPSPLALDVEDLAGTPGAASEARARGIAESEVAVPFDLDRGPLIRARLLRLAPDEHWLLLTKHHIVFDGWSGMILVRELSLLYDAYACGEASPLAELPVQYADYAAWQRERLDDEALARLLAYWKPALAELPALELPTDRPRPHIASHRGGRIAFKIDEGLTRALKELCRRERVTLFMTLLAAFQVLLHRYSGQEDIAVGVPVAGRSRHELEQLIGFFVNTVVLRGDLRGQPTFDTYLARVRRTALDAYAHDDLPFEKLVEALAPSRDLSRNPLYQVSFRLGNLPPATLQLAGLAVQQIDDVGRESAKFDLSLGAFDMGGALSMYADYATDLFDAATVERLAAHYRALLQAIVADPARPIAQLPLVSAAERRQVLVEWNDTAFALPADASAPRMFAAQVAASPAAAAVVCAEQQLTYAGLDARANQLAHRLRELGVGPDVPVAVAMERSIDLVVALLGIMKAGGAYVPLDPDHPRERLAAVMAAVDAPVVLTGRGLRELLPAHAGQTVCLDADWPAIAAQPETDPACAAGGASLAYVIHTSGSTGQPKGVMIEQRSLANHIAWMKQRFSPGAGDCVLQTAAISFDQSIWQILFPLVAGARVALPEPGRPQTPDEIVAAIRRHTVTILRIVPTLLAAIVHGPGLRLCPSLRLVIVAGEVLEPDLADAFALQCRAELVNAFGPTEATFVSALHTVRSAPRRARIPVGRPIGNTRAYVLDRHDEPVPVGVQGELCIAGDCVGRGYWRRPDLTARSFVPDPFGADPQARMYRTGDLVRWRADGNLDFLGRLDQQVKIRGVRVELAEIETTLATHPRIQRCVVNCWRDAAGEDRLVAHFVARDGTSVPGAELRDFLRARLPQAMIPANFVGLPALPLTSSGKVDRNALPPPDGGDPAAAATPRVAPRNGDEQVIAAIWAELLGLDEVGVHQDFFDLGGHSLLAMQVLSRVQQVLGVTVSVREFFEAPEIASLAQCVASARADRRRPQGAIGRARGGAPGTET